MNRIVVTIKNFTTHQHYKNRNPPWIKLHVRILNDMNFMRLAPASRCLLMLLWILASENNGTIISTVAEIGFRLRDAKFSHESLTPLIQAGFLTVQADASTPLALAPKSLSETETYKTETETYLPLTPSPGARAPKGKVAFPSEWKPEPEVIDGWERHGINPHIEFASFRDHALANDRRCADWKAAFRNWCRKAIRMKGERRGLS